MSQIITFLLLFLFCFLINSCDISADSAGGQIKNTNNFLKTVMDRSSVRKYTSEKLDNKTIIKMLEYVNRAPSAGNLQAYKIIVIKNKETISKLGKAAFNQDSIYSAPQILVFVALPKVSSVKYSSRGRNLYALQDATIAAAYSQLVIKNFGFDSAWVGAFSTDEVSQVLKLKSDEIPIALIPFGVSAEKNIHKTPRKPLDKLITIIE